MSSRALATVERAFQDEVEAGFRFLVDDYGMSEPRYTKRLLARVSYAGATVGYDVSLDASEGKVLVGAWRTQGGARARAGLGALVEAAGLAPRQRLKMSAQSLSALQQSIANQAGWVRQVHPLLVGDGGWDLVTAAVEP